MTTTSQNITVIEVPTEAGTHWYGQSKAPEALRKAGFQQQLQSLGYQVNTTNIFPEGPQTWQPAQLSSSGARGEEAVLKCLQRLRDSLNQELTAAAKSPSAGSSSALPFFPIVIGGPCTITQAILTAVSTHIHVADTSKKLGLLMVDNDADLTLPSETSALGSTAIMDSMTMSHLTQRAGGLSSLRSFAAHDGKPLINADNFVLFGLDVTQPKPSHFAYLLDNQFRVFTNHAVQEDSVGSMKKALEYLDQRCDLIFLHFDVDVIDSAQWPLGNFPSYGGLSFNTVIKAIQLALASPKVAGLVVTEINPNNDPDGRMLNQLVKGLVDGFASRRQKS